MSNYVSNIYPRHNWYSIGLSLVLHGILLVTILCCFSGLGQSVEPPLRRGSIVLAVDINDSPSEYLSEPEIDNPLESSAAIAPAEPASSSIDPMPPDIIDLAPDKQSNAETTATVEAPGWNAAESLVMDANRLTNVPKSKGSSREFRLSPDDLALIEADQKLLKSRQPVGEPITINVFGSGALSGRKFVFVLDRSQSMGSSGLGVIEASRVELGQAIDRLESHHQFQIIGYHDTTVTLAQRRLLFATEENKSAVAPFLENLVAYGGTEHENGLIAAIAFRPDIIVLLTDGGLPELNSGQLKLIRQLVNGRSQIHCLQFGAGSPQESANFMTRLAEQNQGGYQYIDVNQWKK